MKPIEQFHKNDNEDQPLLVLKSDNGLIFIGEWDGTSGYFFVDRLINISYNEEQQDYISRMEIPGRFYGKVVEFLYLTEWKHGAT
jgi:hypothetical protein